MVDKKLYKEYQDNLEQGDNSWLYGYANPEAYEMFKNAKGPEEKQQAARMLLGQDANPNSGLLSFGLNSAKDLAAGLAGDPLRQATIDERNSHAALVRAQTKALEDKAKWQAGQ